MAGFTGIWIADSIVNIAMYYDFFVSTNTQSEINVLICDYGYILLPKTQLFFFFETKMFFRNFAIVCLKKQKKRKKKQRCLEF